MSLVLQEDSTKILSDTLIAKNKLKAMKDQLEILLSKKIRIENEIKVLSRTIKRKQKNFQLLLKTNVNLEGYGEDGEPTDELKKLLKETFTGDQLQQLYEYDLLELEIQQLLEEVREG